MELNNTYLAVSGPNHSLYPTPVGRLEENTNGGVNATQTGTTSSNFNARNNSMEEFSQEFPPGYRFRPSDDELIMYYLTRRIMNEPLPHNKIKDVNLYLSPPDRLAAEHMAVEENEWYFFTPRDRKYPNGDRPDRGVVGKDKSKTGYWKATGADNQVLFKGQVVGSKKSLVYYQIQGNPPKGTKTNWIMHEYRILEISDKKRKKTHSKDMKLDDWVLCKIYNKNDKATKSSTKSKMENMSNPKTTESDDDDCHTNPELVEHSQLPQPNANMDNMKQAEAEAETEEEAEDLDSLFSNDDLLALLNDPSEMYPEGYFNFEAQPFSHYMDLPVPMLDTTIFQANFIVTQAPVQDSPKGDK